jgi:hypothetical protein
VKPGRYERALAICEKVLGPEHPDTAITRCRVGATDGAVTGASMGER